jgi:cell division protein FtsI/penicillin-binding protein 2
MDKNSKPEVTNLHSTNNKVKVINFVLCLAIFAMIAYVFNISVLNHADWAKASGSGQSTEQVLEADRGTIYSSDKYAPAEVLAQSTTTFELCLDPFNFANEIKKIVNK